MVLLGGLFPPVADAVDLWREGESSLQLTGYYKNLLSRSETIFPSHEPFTLDLNRLRLELRGRAGERATLNIQYDHELFLGSYLRTDQFRVQKSEEPHTYLDLENAYVDRPRIFARDRLYRGYFALSSSPIDVTIGRQRIAWGTARFWNPADLLNPFNPIQLEREERTGVDAALADFHLGPLSTLSLVYAPQENSEGSSAAARVRTNRRGFDFSAMGGRFREDRVVGFDFAGAVKQAGVRGEATYTEAESGRDFVRAVLGGDYTFPNTLSLAAEIYYNGEGERKKEAYLFQRLFSGEILSLARRYVGGSVGYDITPLLRWDNDAILNLDDGSLFFSPNLVYSIIANLDWAVGLQFFMGTDGSEYGAFRNVYYTQLQWFF